MLEYIALGFMLVLFFLFACRPAQTSQSRRPEPLLEEVRVDKPPAGGILKAKGAPKKNLRVGFHNVVAERSTTGDRLVKINDI